MRLWHKDLIKVLPDKQLQGQWRECCLIAKRLHDGTLNHLLVNKVKEYPMQQFMYYTGLVFLEMRRRGKGALWSAFQRYHIGDSDMVGLTTDVYPDWHNDRYLRQCYYNLQEKYDCGGITWDEWSKVVKYCTEHLECDIL